jgi:hypothetical protein
LRDEELVRRSKDNVLIETLQAGSLGLPTVAGPTYPVSLGSMLYSKYCAGDLSHHLINFCLVHILHPSILILTKLKRWDKCYDSTRPKTMLKNQSDQRDIEFIIDWLAGKGMVIEFDKYQGKPKVELLHIVRRYYDRFVQNLELIEKLKTIILEDDWNEMMQL